MSAELIAGFLPALVALAIGIAAGWAFARAGRADAEAEPSKPPAAAEIPEPMDDGRAPPAAAESPERENPATERATTGGAGPKLRAIEAELHQTRALMEEGEEEIRAFAEEIAQLDAAIKRANTRLRALLREIKKRALGE